MKAIEESYQSPPKSLTLNAALNLMIHHRKSFASSLGYHAQFLSLSCVRVFLLLVAVAMSSI